MFGGVFGLGFLGFLVFVFVLFLLPPPIRSVSTLLMMTWAHRPHGVRTRGKKILGDLRCGEDRVELVFLGR